MKKLAIAGALMLLAGCAEVENYNNVVKTPAPDWLAGYWQTKGPQRALVSPEAIGSLIVTKEGDTLDCRQWQRVIAVPGKLTLMSDDLTNVTVKRELYEVERDGNTIEYDGMTMERVDRPTAECSITHTLTLPPLQKKVASPFSSVTTLSCRFPRKSRQVLLP